METTVKTAEFDLVAANYNEMFQGILKVLPEFWSHMPREVETYKTLINSEISWAKQHLKKQDRIVWYLRWVRLMLWADICGTNNEWKAAYFIPELKRMAAITGQGVNEEYRILRFPYNSEIHRIQSNLDHYLSLPVPVIQNTVFDKQTPDNLFQEFSKAEDTWIEQAKSFITPEAGDQIIVQFQDGWAWWKLDRGYCSAEARAMGHCGNVNGKYNHDERILSLRRPTKVGAETMWEPFLTFILDGDNYIGEMKGRGNEKPAERYHKYITGLLERTDLVKGIKGGGYLPSHNFSLNDLDYREQEALRKKNPNMVSCRTRLRELSGTPDTDLVKRISKSDQVPGYYDADVNGWVKQEWKNPGECIKDDLHGDVEIAYELAIGENPEYTRGYETSQAIMKLLARLPYSDLDLIDYWLKSQGAGSVGSTVNKGERDEAKWEGAHRELLIKHLTAYGQMSGAMEEARVKLWDVWNAGFSEGMRADIKEQIQEALLEAWSGKGTRLIGNESDFWNHELKEVMPASVAAGIADGGDGDEYEEEDDYDGEDAEDIKVDYNYTDPYDFAYRQSVDQLAKISKGLDRKSRKAVEELENKFNRGERADFVEWAETVMPGSFAGVAEKSWDVKAAHRACYAEFAQGVLPFPPDEETKAKALRNKQKPWWQQNASLLLHKDSSFDIIAADYNGMFQKVLTLDLPAHMYGEHWADKQYGQKIKDEITWAKSHLKKSDRIVWWLRWFRLAVISEINQRAAGAWDQIMSQQLRSIQNKTQTPKTDTTEISAWKQQPEVADLKQKKDTIEKVFNDEVRAQSTRTGEEIQVQTMQWFRGNHSTMDHFLSLPVQEIQTLVWDKQTPYDLTAEFTGAERAWQEKTKGLLRPHTEPERDYYNEIHSDPEDEEGGTPEIDMVFLQFSDGWAWWKLSRAYCSEEAKAMGHCGNVTGQNKTTQRILSLRKPVKVGKDTYWEPHLTFILEPTGRLGEMKGKGNIKPAVQYHKYIIPLLEDSRIKGIKGGGYLPSHNFAFNDLTKEQQESVLTKNPSFGLSFVQQLKTSGPTPEIIKSITDALGFEEGGDDPHPYDPKIKGWITEKSESVDQLIEERGNDDAKWVSKQLNNNGDEYIDWSEGQGLSDAIEQLDTKEKELIKNFILIEHPEEVAQWKEDQKEEEEDDDDDDDDPDWDDVDLAEFIERYEPGEVESELLRALEDGSRSGAESQMFKALESAINDFAIEVTGESLYLTKHTYKGKEGITWDSPCYLYLTLEAGAELADKGEPFSYYDEEGERGDSVIKVDAPYYGWADWDGDAFSDYIADVFKAPVDPKTKAKADAKEQKELEKEAKKRPDMIARRENGKIVGWSHNPEYKGPKLGPGGVEIDENGNPIKKKRKSRAKIKGAAKKIRHRAARIASLDDNNAMDDFSLNKKTNELLEELQALPYAADIKVFGSTARGKEHPNDIDLVLDLRGKEGKHDAWQGLLVLAKKYLGGLDAFIIADNGLDQYQIWCNNEKATGWVPARNPARMLKSMEKEGVPLASVNPLKEASIVKRAREDKPIINAHQSGTVMWIDWMWVPPNIRGKGVGRMIYEAWEEKLPTDVTLLRLQSADAGDGNSYEFWDKMGFYPVYSEETGDYETDNQMWKGVNGNPTPDSIQPDHEDEEFVEGRESVVESREINKEAAAEDYSASTGIKWYHGTSIANAEKILKDGWLRPGMPSKYVTEDIPRYDAVYLTRWPLIARDYGYHENNVEGMVLEVEADPTKLLPDEDSIFSACDGHGLLGRKGPVVEKIKEIFLKYWNENTGTGDEEVLAKTFEEAWQQFKEGTEDAPAEVGEWMKDVAEHIREHDPELSKQIVEITGHAAHIGPVKVVGKAKIGAAIKPVEPIGPIYFYIKVPKDARDHFWEEPPEGNLEFWAFKNRPRAFVNQKIIFKFGQQPVAEAVILRIEKPGQTKCENTGKYEEYWKVYWNPTTFKKYKTKTAASQHWYHGTSAENAKKIQAEGYLRPGMPSLYTQEDFPRDGAIYITSNDSIAESYAAERNDGVILEVVVPNLNQLLPDEDAVHEALVYRTMWHDLSMKNDTAICEQIQQIWLKYWNKEMEASEIGPVETFEEAWKLFEEYTSDADVGEHMKDFVDHLHSKYRKIAHEVINISEKAAYVGSLKVIGVFGETKNPIQKSLVKCTNCEMEGTGYPECRDCDKIFCDKCWPKHLCQDNDDGNVMTSKTAALEELPPEVIKKAEEMLTNARRNNLIPGDVSIVGDWYMETFTLGCSEHYCTSVDEQWTAFMESYEEYINDPRATVIGDPDEGVFIEIMKTRTTRLRDEGKTGAMKTASPFSDWFDALTQDQKLDLFAEADFSEQDCYHYSTMKWESIPTPDREKLGYYGEVEEPEVKEEYKEAARQWNSQDSDQDAKQILTDLGLPLGLPIDPSPGQGGQRHIYMHSKFHELPDEYQAAVAKYFKDLDNISAHSMGIQAAKFQRGNADNLRKGQRVLYSLDQRIEGTVKKVITEDKTAWIAWDYEPETPELEFWDRLVLADPDQLELDLSKQGARATFSTLAELKEDMRQRLDNESKEYGNISEQDIAEWGILDDLPITEDGGLTLYRAIRVKPNWIQNPTQLGETGVYWSYTPGNAIPCNAGWEEGTVDVTIIAKLGPQSVDWQGIWDGILYFHKQGETEVRLAPGDKIQVIEVSADGKKVESPIVGKTITAAVDPEYTDAYKTNESEYAPYPRHPETGELDFDSETPEQGMARHRRRTDWEQSALAALSLGKLTPQEAEERKLTTNPNPRDFKPLPPNLYHVTTGASKVTSGGLKSRYELSMDSGVGLGGGNDKSISFTEDLEIAKAIYSAMLEARQVAAGEFTIQQMLDLATEGAGADRPWITETIQWAGAYRVSNKWTPGQPYPDDMQAFLRDMKPIHLGTFDGLTKEDLEAKGWEPMGNGWDSGRGHLYNYALRPMTAKEKQDIAFDTFKVWCYAREHAGGAMNPLFFSTDVEGLAQIPEKEIAILQFKPIPGAMGTRESALGEIRVYSGAAVQFAGVVNV